MTRAFSHADAVDSEALKVLRIQLIVDGVFEGSKFERASLIDLSLIAPADDESADPVVAHEVHALEAGVVDVVVVTAALRDAVEEHDQFGREYEPAGMLTIFIEPMCPDLCYRVLAFGEPVMALGVFDHDWDLKPGLWDVVNDDWK